ncbi:MAG TPA: ribulose-phosphate 3-epimerase [Gaiellaceae bacterium]|jgi:ribulose-phosphate 3-epimerase
MGWSDWVRGAEIEPSLYASDLARLGEQVESLLAAGVRVFHFDVGDGHFIEPITMGPIVLRSISERVHAAGAAIDVHLMVEEPAKHFAQFASAGGDSVTFHYEAVDDVPATIALARGHGLQAGVAFNPDTRPADVAPVASGADLVLCMAIHPGYSGQPFQERTFERVLELRGLLPPEVRIQVDGGVDDDNVVRLRNEGASLFVAGSAIFDSGDPLGAYRRLAQAVR